MTILKESSEGTSECNTDSETMSSSKGPLDTRRVDVKAINVKAINADLDSLRIRKIFTLIFIHDTESNQVWHERVRRHGPWRLSARTTSNTTYCSYIHW